MGQEWGSCANAATGTVDPPMNSEIKHFYNLLYRLVVLTGFSRCNEQRCGTVGSKTFAFIISNKRKDRKNLAAKIELQVATSGIFRLFQE